MIDIQENLSTIIIFVLICIIIYLGYNYYLFKQKILLLEKNITEFNKIKYLDNIPNTNTNTDINANSNGNSNANPNINANTNGNGNGNGNGNANSNINTNTNGNTNANTYACINAFPNTNINTNTNAYAYANANANANTNAYVNANTNANGNINSINMLYKYEQCEQYEQNFEKKQNNIIDITNCQNEYSDNENYKLLNNNTIEDYGVIPINLNLLLHTAVQNKIDNENDSYQVLSFYHLYRKQIWYELY
jgi:hypothetical protein